MSMLVLCRLVLAVHEVEISETTILRRLAKAGLVSKRPTTGPEEMGHLQSRDNVQFSVESFQDKILQHARSISEIAYVTYEDLRNYVQEINRLSEGCMDAEGKQLVFFIKKGSDAGVLWKNNVQIVCMKFNPENRESRDKARLMNLKQFLKVYRSLKSQFDAAEGSHMEQGLEASGGSENTSLDASLLMRDIDLNVGSTSECCICFERPHEVLLPCFHSFCQLCIQHWNLNNHTCPICRKNIGNDKDAWVIFDTPNGLEIGEELVSSMMDIIDNQSQSD